MYAYLRGTLEEIEPNKIILDVNGIGYLITVPTSLMNKLPPKGETVKLYTYFNVREDAQEMYGFYDREEKSLFEKLISVSGIGPKTAIAMLSTLTPRQLAIALVSGDVKTLIMAPGIGKKTAQRMILELKEKIDRETLESSEPAFDYSPGNEPAEVIQALMALGYQAHQARQALNKLGNLDQDTSTLIKLALKALDNKQ